MFMRRGSWTVALGLMLGALVFLGLMPVAEAQVGDQTITVQADGTVQANGQPARQAKWDILADKSVFRYKILDRPGSFVERVDVTVVLPGTVTADAVNPKIFAVHGIDQATITPIDQQTLQVTAVGIGEDATLTVTLDFPSSAIQFTALQRVVGILQRLSLGQWLILALIMPLLTGVYVVTLLAGRRGDLFLKPAATAQPTPPSTLPPAMVGVLVNGYVGPREIAATLIDLARRGYIDIIYQADGSFGFSQKRVWQQDKQLQAYERLLLGQIFGQAQGVVTTEQQINQQLNAHVWSDAISQAIESIYTAMQQLGYFPDNPQRSHLIVRFVGIAMFFLSVLGLTISFYVFGDQLLVTIPWLVSLLISPFLNRFALLVPRRTEAGRTQAAAWLAFRQSLAQPIAVRYQEELELYERYLAYAIVLSVEGEWTSRYAALPCRLPTWFFSQTVRLDSYGQLAAVLFSIVGFIGQKFSFSRKPTAV